MGGKEGRNRLDISHAGCADFGHANDMITSAQLHLTILPTRLHPQQKSSFALYTSAKSSNFLFPITGYNLFELNYASVPYEHRAGSCTANCGGEGGSVEGGTWYDTFLSHAMHKCPRFILGGQFTGEHFRL